MTLKFIYPNIEPLNQNDSSSNQRIDFSKLIEDQVLEEKFPEIEFHFSNSLLFRFEDFNSDFYDVISQRMKVKFFSEDGVLKISTMSSEFIILEEYFVKTFDKTEFKDFILSINNGPTIKFILIEEVIGNSFKGIFYPTISGTIKSYFAYPYGNAKNNDISGALTFGLDFPKSNFWNYAIKFPKSIPPHNGNPNLLSLSQSKFYAVELSKAENYSKWIDSVIELYIDEADQDEQLSAISSTYISSSDKFVIGNSHDGPRLIDFSGLLKLDGFNFNDFLAYLHDLFFESLKSDIKIKFSVNIIKGKMKFYLEKIINLENKVDNQLLSGNNNSDFLLDVSSNCKGDGSINAINDIIFVRFDRFQKSETELIAKQVTILNKKLLLSKKPILLIGFGRWGSSDSWLGIPIKFEKISNARIIIESMHPNIIVEPSYGSHFYHYLIKFNILYYSKRIDEWNEIDWEWLNSLEIINEFKYVKHVKSSEPINAFVDGRTGKGYIKK